MEYKTKVMRPANLRGLAAARQTIDTAIEDAEQKSAATIGGGSAAPARPRPAGLAGEPS